MTRKAFALGLLLLLVLSLTSMPTAQATDPVLINAAGATFPYPIYSKWFDDFHKTNPGVQINYASVGSGAGIGQLQAGTVDFGASDMPMTDEQLAAAKVKVLHFPTVLGAAVVTYNLPGVSTELKFTQKALAGIYLGTITKWNDSEIAKANPGVNLPNADIVVVHRSDGSGTTFIWTDFLSKVSSDWASKVGAKSSVNWPVGLGGKGSEGVSGLVKQTPHSIGYVELIYAIQNKMSYGLLQNAAGKFIKADLASVSAAAAGAAKTIPDDFRVSITNAPGATAYPISSFTYLLIPVQIQDAAKRDAIKQFLNWMVTSGQNSVEALSYAQLPKAVQAKELKAISLVH
jgi:phosphate transport system substrate-binding protein